MDIAQVFIFDLGWVFFAAWGMVLAAVGAIAFGRDLFPSTVPRSSQSERRSVQKSLSSS